MHQPMQEYLPQELNSDGNHRMNGRTCHHSRLLISFAEPSIHQDSHYDFD